MSSKITSIGRCRGCDKARQLDDGVCTECLRDPRRASYPKEVETNDGRKLTGARAWAEIAFRLRTDPVFHLETFSLIKRPIAQAIFIAEFGFPAGAVPDHSLVTLIRGNPSAARNPKIKAFLETLEPEDEPRPALQLVR